MGPQTIIFYGRSGAGKGTQGKLVKEYIESKDPEHKVLYIETGNGLRALAARDVHTGHITKNILDNGGLIPVFLPIWVWTEYLVNNFTGSEHIILDGIARRLPETPVIDSALEFYGRKNLVVVYIDIPREVAFERLKARGRYDDTDRDINNRLDWYEENVVPAINFFRNNDRYRFLDINGNRAPEEVHKDILEQLKI